MTGRQPKLDFLNKETVGIKNGVKTYLNFEKKIKVKSENRDILI